MKRLPSGSANKVASRDPCVELDVSGKHLTDTGFAELALGLTCSLTCEGEHGKVVRLEELCLAGNSLSAASLWLLSQVVRLAADDLRDLDVSGNGITVANEEEAWAWELFLRSFRSCVVLRRLDFSGNCLGSRAFEIFARVYGREEPLDFLTLDEAECGDPLGRVGGPSARMVESNDSDPGKIASTVGSRTPQKGR